MASVASDAQDDALLKKTLKDNVEFEVVDTIRTLKRTVERGQRGRVLQLKESIHGNTYVFFEGLGQDFVFKCDLGKLQVVDCVLELKWGEEVLPPHEYEQEALNHLGKYMAQFAFYVAGPAVPWAQKCTKAALAVFLGVPVATWFVTSCGTDGGFAKAPPWIFGVAGVALLYLLYLEDKVRKFTIVYQSVMLCKEGTFKLFGMAVPFRVWLWGRRMLSLAAHADLVTSGVFLAKAIVTDQCSDRVTRMWAWTMRTSILGRIVGEVPFGAIAGIAWFFMVGQIVYVVALTTPRKSYHKETKEPKPLHQRLVPFHERGEYNVVFDSFVGEAHSISHIVDIYADATRMSTVTSQRKDFFRKSYESEPAGVVADDLGGLLVQAAGKFMTFLIMESAITLNVQSAGLALSKAASGSLDMQVALSLVFGLAMALYNFYCEVDTVLDYRRMILDFGVPEFLAYLKTLMVKDFVPEGCATFQGVADHFEQSRGQQWQNRKAMAEGILRTRATLTRLMPIFYLIWGVYLVLVGRAIYQVVWAAICPDGLHNVGVGCVTPHGF